MSDIRHRKIFIIQRLLKLLILQLAKMRGAKSGASLLFENAKLFIGRDASPLDFVGDDLGCAESVTNILKKVVRFPIIPGTWTLWYKLGHDTRFIAVMGLPQTGDIIISPTGTGNGKIRGHVGIIGEGNTIMSASSKDGIWRSFYTIRSWKARYQDRGGFSVYYFRLI